MHSRERLLAAKLLDQLLREELIALDTTGRGDAETRAALADKISIQLVEARKISGRDARVDYAADFADWLLERDELDDLYATDSELFFALDERVWSVPGAAVAPPDKGPTFAELGIPFPYFEGPVEDVSNYRSRAFCCISQRVVDHAFCLGIGDTVRRACTQCGADNYLRADDAVDIACRECGTDVEFPDVDGDEVCVSYDALRAGDAAINTDTVYGMVGWKEAEAGQTHGVPGLQSSEVETVDSGNWVAARIPSEHLWELVRTPNYSTWQGEMWQFCADTPMIYLGSWGQIDFHAHADDGDGRMLFERLADNELAGQMWESLGSASSFCTYLFRCPETGRLAMHWDMT